MEFYNFILGGSIQATPNYGEPKAVASGVFHPTNPSQAYIVVNNISLINSFEGVN